LLDQIIILVGHLIESISKSVIKKKKRIIKKFILNNSPIFAHTIDTFFSGFTFVLSKQNYPSEIFFLAFALVSVNLQQKWKADAKCECIVGMMGNVYTLYTNLVNLIILTWILSIFDLCDHLLSHMETAA